MECMRGHTALLAHSTGVRDDYVSANIIHKFIWGLWERSRYFRNLCSALRKLDNHVVLLLGFLYLCSVERKRLRVHWQHRFGETGVQTSPSYANYGKLVGHFSGEKQFCKAGYCKSILHAGTAASGYLNCEDCVLC